MYDTEVDTDKMELWLTADTIAKATSLEDSMVNGRKVTLRELQSLIGLLSSGCLVAPCGRAFVRRLISPSEYIVHIIM